VNSRSELRPASNGLFAAKVAECSILEEAAFHQMIRLERRRTSRSRKSFVLMLLDMRDRHGSRSSKISVRKVLATLSTLLRETDVIGWYKEGSVIGVMFTEITVDTQSSIPSTLMSRVTETLKSDLSPSQFHHVSITFHLLSESPNRHSANSDTYPGVYRAYSPSVSETIS
jgi:hypothetical protein